MTQPNVLLFFTDDQRFDALGALGNPDIHTPNLDKLVASGTSFTHAHIPGGTNGAVCMPSRAMMITGRSLFHLEGEGQTISAEHVVLGQHLRANGYHCFGTGKWHNSPEAFNRSFDDGDQIFFGGMEDHWNVPAHPYDPTGAYASRLPFVRDAWHDNQVEWKHGDHISAGVHSTDLFGQTAIDFLESFDQPNPFFLYVALMAPHDPRTMPPEYLAQYDPDAITLPPNISAEHPFPFGVEQIRDELLAPTPRTEAEIRRHLVEYYAMITHLDAVFGRVYETLAKQNLLDNTIILFAGDNGLALGQHGLMGKQNLYDHSVRVPLVMAGPSIPQGARRDAFCYLFDVYPTLCDLLHLPTPDSVEGHSLLPTLTNSAETPRDALYLAYTDLVRGVRVGDHKLIEYANGRVQLFDLATDPFEQNNLAAQDPKRVQALRQRLVQLRDEWDDLSHPLGAAFWQQRPDLAPTQESA